MSHSARAGIGNWIGAGLFFCSAALQYNDPDPLRWALVYGGAGVACLAWRGWQRGWLLAGAVALVALTWTAAFLPGLGRLSFGHLFESMKAETPEIEEARELLGLLIVAVWTGVLAVRGWRRKAS
jgi:hypothetical protein